MDGWAGVLGRPGQRSAQDFMDLEELKKRLYSPAKEVPGRPKPAWEKIPALEPGDEVSKQWQPGEDKSENTVRKKSRKRFWVGLGLISLLVLAGAGSGYIWWAKRFFDPGKVYFKIFGPEQTASGEETVYVVKYRNNAKTTLKNVVLTFVYPPQAVPVGESDLFKRGEQQESRRQLQDIASSQEGQEEFKVRTWGSRGTLQRFSAKLEYQPTGSRWHFKNEAEFQSGISYVPLVLNLDLPPKIVSGQTLNYFLQYLNTGAVALQELKIKIDYPAGFTFKTSLPSPAAETNVWLVEEIAPQEEKKILISGVLEGREGENKLFRAQIGAVQDNNFISYAETSKASLVSVSPLLVEQTTDAAAERVNLGQTVNYKIKYRNTTEETIGPLTISVKITSQAVDWQTIRVGGGFFNSADNTLVWKAASWPALNSLAGRQEGELTFSLRLKDKLPLENFSDKNFSILTEAQIDSENVPLGLIGTRLKGENQLTLRMNTHLTFKAKGVYQDTLLPNSGPLPPRVGQMTSYTIYWQLLNTLNDVNDLKVEANLPSYMQWLARTSPAGENLQYDARSGKITWSVGRLASAAGILSPVRYVAFQVGLTPAANQIGRSPLLVGEAVASGQDSFTEKEISERADAVSTSLPDDPAMGWKKGRVEQ